MNRRARFHNRGNGVVFNCACCGRRAREVDQGGNGTCQECFEIAGLDNYINDNGYTTDTPEYKTTLKECEGYLKTIEKRGGKVENVKGWNGFIWPGRPPKEEAVA